MRALEKVAQEKGLVKPDPIQKTASASKIDLTPSDNLMENVLKLCNGLRRQGFEKEASEVETNYLSYKQAQTLYDVSQEKGEDQIQAAHPEGSHKMENIEGDMAVFETVVSRHLKVLDVVKKTPAGKLTEASAIIDAVKTVLGQTSPVSLDKFVKDYAAKAYTALVSICNVASDEITLFSAHLWIKEFGELLIDPNRASLLNAQTSVDHLEETVKPGGYIGVSDKTWSRFAPQFADIRKWIAWAISGLDEGKVPAGAYVVSQQDKTPSTMSGVKPVATVPAPASKQQAATKKTDDLYTSITNSTKLSEEEKKSYIAWLSKPRAVLDGSDPKAIEEAAQAIDEADKTWRAEGL